MMTGRQLAYAIERTRLGRLMFFYMDTRGLQKDSVVKIVDEIVSTDKYKKCFEDMVKFCEENKDGIIEASVEYENKVKGK